MIAIIPARGGSKRIPRKNIKEFHGRPMISYAIENAINSGLFDAVFVSTDDKEVASIAKTFGAHVPFLRSKKNSDDHATTYDVLEEVLEYYNAAGKLIEQACCIYPTTPLLSSVNLIDAYDEFVHSNFDVLMSSVKFDRQIQRGFKLGPSNDIQLLHPELILERSQDLEPTYHDAGAFYFFNTKTLLINKSLWSGQIGAFVLPNSHVQDIDTPEDWKIAELKYELLK